MIELLDRLREADPETYKRIARGIPLQPRGQYLAFDGGKITACQYHEPYIPFDNLLPEAACAWLQAVLQDAISNRGWIWEVSLLANKKDHCACISEVAPGYDGDHWTEEHEYMITEQIAGSPAEALLRAYAEAISK